MKKQWKRAVVILVLVILTVWTLWGNRALEINEHMIRSSRIPEAFDGFRIAQISDLHNAEFGEENEKLLEMMREAEPDIIVITGDLIDSRRTNVEISLAFVRKALEIAPVYYVNGNHESRVEAYLQLKQGLDDLGVIRLEFEKTTIQRGGEAITIMGVNDPGFLLDPTLLLDRMTDPGDGYTILLSHRPELFDDDVSAGLDLVFTGHAHGGQIRLPIVGGLVAPHQGYFPQYDAGSFTEGKTTMLVSRGIGNSIFPLRFNNRPEIPVAVLEYSE